MVEVAGDWNYANTGIYGESAFILQRRRARRFLSVQLPLLQRCRCQRRSRATKLRALAACEHEKST
jgi:hypothetical protein